MRPTMKMTHCMKSIIIRGFYKIILYRFMWKDILFLKSNIHKEYLSPYIWYNKVKYRQNDLIFLCY